MMIDFFAGNLGRTGDVRSGPPTSGEPHADFNDVLLMVLRLETILCFQKFFK